MRAADPDEYLDMDDSDVDDFEIIPGRKATVLTCARVHLEDNPMSPSAKRELAKSLLRCAGSRHSQTLRWEQCRCRCLKTRRRWTLMPEWSQRCAKRCKESQSDVGGTC